jgi:hypothetical protein
MAIIQKALARKAAATTSETVYTVPADTSAIVTNVVVANANASAKTVTISLDGVPIISGGVVNGNDTIVMDIRQVLAAGDTVTAFASSTDISIHISGVEIA